MDENLKNLYLMALLYQFKGKDLKDLAYLFVHDPAKFKETIQQFIVDLIDFRLKQTIKEIQKQEDRKFLEVLNG